MLLLSRFIYFSAKDSANVTIAVFCFLIIFKDKPGFKNSSKIIMEKHFAYTLENFAKATFPL